MKISNTRRKQQGFSLIEILLVIGIIAVLAIAAFLIFPQVQASQRANAEQSNIMTIAASVKQMFNGRYTGLDNAAVANGKLAPVNMVVGTDLVSSWGEDVTVADATGTDAGKKFTIQYDAVPQEVCLKLLPGLIQNFESVGAGATGTTAVTDAATIISGCVADGTIIVTSN